MNDKISILKCGCYFFIVLFLVFLFLINVHYKYHGKSLIPPQVVGIMTWKGCEENHGKKMGHDCFFEASCNVTF